MEPGGTAVTELPLGEYKIEVKDFNDVNGDGADVKAMVSNLIQIMNQLRKI